MSKTWKIIIGAIAGVLLLFVVCVVIISTSNDSKNGAITAQVPTASPVATPLSPEPTPALAPLSADALVLLVLYQELLEFKDEEPFHFFCYGRGGSYYEWAEQVKGIGDRSGIGLIQETGIAAGDIRQMGWEYCQNQGQETEHTRYIKSQMKPRWLEALEQ